MSDIFISYASKDKNVANAICAKLEQLQLKCWIAPRDIKPGEEYAGGIVRGIDVCRCMVVVFSGSANASQHVLREVERAVGRNVVIIPFRIDDIIPSDSMDYFLKVAHWLDAKDMDLDSAIDHLARTIAAFLEKELPEQPTRQQSVNQPAMPVKPNQRSKIISLLAVALFIPIVWLGYSQFANQSTDQQKRQAQVAALVGDNGQLLDAASSKNINAALDISDLIPNRQIALKAWIEPKGRSEFMEGDKLSFKTTLDRDAYLAVYVHSIDGSSYLIYPNHLQTPKLIKKDSVFNVGNSGTFELEIAPPFGVDIVQFIATTDIDEYSVLLKKLTPIAGMNIALAERSELTRQMSGIKAKGIAVTQATSNNQASAGANLWGETIVIIQTRAGK